MDQLITMTSLIQANNSLHKNCLVSVKNKNSVHKNNVISTQNAITNIKSLYAFKVYILHPSESLQELS